MPKKPSAKKQSLSGTNKKPSNNSLKKSKPQLAQTSTATEQKLKAGECDKAQNTAIHPQFPIDPEQLDLAVELSGDNAKMLEMVIRYKRLIREGDKAGLSLLLQMARLSCMALEFADLVQSKMVSELMQELPAWPVLWVPDKNFNEVLLKRAGMSGLGSKVNCDMKISTALKGAQAAFNDLKLTPKLIARILFEMMVLLRLAGAFRIDQQNWIQELRILSDDYRKNRNSLGLESASLEDNSRVARYVSSISKLIQHLEETCSLETQELYLTLVTFFGAFKKPVDARLVEKYISECTALPEPTLDSKSAWLTVLRRIFLDMTDNAPQNVPEYQHMLGEFRNCADKGERGASSEGQAKKYIVDAVKQAFESMLNTAR